MTNKEKNADFSIEELRILKTMYAEEKEPYRAAVLRHAIEILQATSQNNFLSDRRNKYVQ